MEHMQSYEKPDLSAEVADEAFLLKLFARYEDSGDGKNFKMANGSAYSIKPGLVSGPDFDGTNIGGPAHVANVMELMLVAKGSFEKDSGYFNTPYEKELPIAGYIAKLQGFELKNVTPEMIAGLDPKVKAEIDKQWAAKQKELGIEVEPDRSVTKDQKFDSPADAGSALATRLEDISQEIDGKFGAGENLPQDKAHSDFVADLHDRIRTGDTVGINKVIADFERDYGAQVPKEQQAEFKTAMDALKTEVAEFAAKNKLDLEPKKSEPAPVTPTPTPAPVPPPTVP